MENQKKNKILLRVLSVVIIVLAHTFGFTWPSGYCLGDALFQSIGLSPWSDGSQGTHYVAILAIAAEIGAFALYASTTKNKLQTFRYFMLAVLALIFLGA